MQRLGCTLPSFPTFLANCRTYGRPAMPYSAFRRSVGSISQTQQAYDVFIIGGGVLGSALLYELTKFTNIRRIGLAERRSDFALASTMSQNAMLGDIETNYKLEKARSVKRHADLLRNYATKLPPALRDKYVQRSTVRGLLRCIYKMQKMALAVGNAECDLLERRYHEFKELFPRMELISKKRIREVEPNVVQLSHGVDRKENLTATLIHNEHSAINFHNVARSFIQNAMEAAGSKLIDAKTDVAVRRLHRRSDKTYCIETTSGSVKANVVVVTACGSSLMMAQQLGYASHLACFPVGGSFYFARDAPVLQGKVYTMQDVKLPFTAIHGDPDVQAGLRTRFGPTTVPLPLLERFNPSSFFDYVKVVHLDKKCLKSVGQMMVDPTIRRFAVKNLLYTLPFYGQTAFLKDVQKIVPRMSRDDLVFAYGYGGVRPQLMDKRDMRLLWGEGKIQGDNIIFNITPSPGATTCLGNAETDMRTICATLGAPIDEERFAEILMRGEYPIDCV